MFSPSLHSQYEAITKILSGCIMLLERPSATQPDAPKSLSSGAEVRIKEYLPGFGV